MKKDRNQAGVSLLDHGILTSVVVGAAIFSLGTWEGHEGLNYKIESKYLLSTAAIARVGGTESGRENAAEYARPTETGNNTPPPSTSFNNQARNPQQHSTAQSQTGFEGEAAQPQEGLNTSF